MDKNIELSNALKSDFLMLKEQINDLKSDGWENPDNYWISILTNIMHMGSNSVTLTNRKGRDSYKTSEKFNELVRVNMDEQKKLLLDFVPGSPTMKKEKKIELLLNIIDKINNIGGLENCFIKTEEREKLLKNLTQFKGIGCKIARNVYMDLYHPLFRNGSIPIDSNWEKIGLYLGEKWKDPCKDETKILQWREEYINKEIIKEDWEFDRLVYQTFQKKNSSVKNLIHQ